MIYEYECHDLRSVIKRHREIEKDIEMPDHTICINFLNSMGADGWKVINNPQDMIVYFERAVDE